jgi:hypothetical protein
MPYKTGSWGIQAKERSRRRRKGGLGYIGEIEAESILLTNKLPNHSGADFRYKGKLVDVKTSLPDKRGYWKFNLYKQKGKIDYFLFICKNRDKKTEYIFLIPNSKLKRNNLCIHINKTKGYLKYLMRGGLNEKNK